MIVSLYIYQKKSTFCYGVDFLFGSLVHLFISLLVFHNLLVSLLTLETVALTNEPMN